MKRAFFLILSGIVGSMGLGAGTVLIIYLTVFENLKQTQAQGINLLFSLPLAALSIIIYKKKGLIKSKNIGFLIIFGIVGAIVGYIILDRISPEFLSKIFGGALIITALYQLFSSSGKQSRKSRQNR
ncbi:MAG: TSUP family transporter [Acutalibacteraceae bacterium]